MFAAAGIPVVDADRAAHALYVPGSELVRDLARAYFDLGFTLEAQRFNVELTQTVTHMLRVAEAVYASGRGLQQDVLLAQVELSKLIGEKKFITHRRWDSRASFRACEGWVIQASPSPWARAGELAAFANDVRAALDRIRESLKQGRVQVYDADLRGYFDSIPHDKLMACLRMRVVDSSVLKLIRMWLKAPIIEVDENGKQQPPKKNRSGTPQGGVISPLLANIVLDVLDQELAKHGYIFVRYADDFLVLSK